MTEPKKRKIMETSRDPNKWMEWYNLLSSDESGNELPDDESDHDEEDHIEEIPRYQILNRKTLMVALKMKIKKISV